MIYKRHRKGISEPGGFIHLEDQLSHRKVSGYGASGNFKLADKVGTTWTGTGERNDDKTIYYRFRDSNGRMISGLGDGDYLLLRDDRGRIWKGFVE